MIRWKEYFLKTLGRHFVEIDNLENWRIIWLTRDATWDIKWTLLIFFFLSHFFSLFVRSRSYFIFFVHLIDTSFQLSLTRDRALKKRKLNSILNISFFFFEIIMIDYWYVIKKLFPIMFWTTNFFEITIRKSASNDLVYRKNRSLNYHNDLP